MSGPVENLDFAKAEELLSAVRPHQARWQPHPRRWIFRGQLDAAWGLVPTALRPDAWKNYPSSKFRRDQGVEHSVAAENQAYCDVFDAMDRAGLDIPEDSQLHRNAHTVAQVLNYRREGAWWPPSRILSALALAQHYGMPTRLLDWTWRPLVGAYFAARDRAQVLKGERAETVESDRLAVWALDMEYIRHTWHEPVGDDPEPEVSIVTVPYASNPNLRAQAGLFTVDRKLGVPRSLEVAIAAGLEIRAPDGPAPLARLTLPAAEAPRLLQLLAWEGVSAASVFPGHRGAVESVQERHLWASP